MNLLRLFSLPLLTKELIEQAQNKRTYVFRVISALVLYGLALYQYSEITAGGGTAGLMNLGRGRAMFQMLTIIQVWMIVLMLPPITCGAITVEKEKDTLAILLLTKLSPWTIIFEKFLSRIFAMGTFQLLSLPLFAMIYGLGGVDLPELVIAILGLALLSLVVGSISLLCSTWFRTTSAAFVMTYVSLFCLMSCCFSQLLTIGGAMTAMNRVGPGRWFGAATWVDFVIAFVIAPGFLVVSSLSMTGLFLYIASRVLVPRAFIPVRNLVLEAFRHADRFFNDLNKVTTGGIVLIADREVLPEFDPIAWRETRKKSLGTFRYQFRVLMLLLTPLMFVISYVLMDGRADFSSPFRGFPAFFWIVSIICLTIHSTAAIPSERIRQTLDVVLVAPMSSFEIVKQKLAGVRRLILILSVPFAILVAFQAIWSGYVTRGLTAFQMGELGQDLIATSLAALVYMPLIMWVGFQLGLRMRTQMQAVLSTFAIIGATCAFPAIFAEVLGVSIGGNSVLTFEDQWSKPAFLILNFFHSLSPINMIFRGPKVPLGSGRQIGLDGQMVWGLLGCHFAFYGYLWWMLRRNALNNFSRIVGRLEASDADEPAVESPQ